jgi:lipopolysaccharide export system ATP-binding protein
VFDFLFGRNSRHPRKPASGFWRIDLSSLGGPITALSRVALNLPQKSRKPPRDEAPRAARSRAAEQPVQQIAQRTRYEPQPPAYQQPVNQMNDYQRPAGSHQQPANEYQQPVNEYQQAANDYPQPVSARRLPVGEHLQPESDYQALASSHQQQPMRNYQQLANARRQTVSDDQQPMNDHQPPASVYRQPEADQQRRPPRDRQRPVGSHQQPATQQGDREALLAVHGVEKSFGKRKVVKGVSLYVRRGEAVGLLGPNGAGKTTVFYMITGLIKADRGRVDLDGFDISALPMYQRARLGIGYLPQEASIFRGLTVEDNIRSVLEIVEPNRKRREAELDNLLDEFHITRLRKTPSIALSGGERRRVEIARALASRPNYMLLDEPFAGIDPIAVGDIQALVRHLTSRGIGVLITDHNVRETLGLTDRAYIIYSGQVLMEGRTEDIVNDPEVRRLYLGEEFRL